MLGFLLTVFGIGVRIVGSMKDHDEFCKSKRTGDLRNGYSYVDNHGLERMYGSNERCYRDRYRRLEGRDDIVYEIDRWGNKTEKYNFSQLQRDIDWDHYIWLAALTRQSAIMTYESYNETRKWEEYYKHMDSINKSFKPKTNGFIYKDVKTGTLLYEGLLYSTKLNGEFYRLSNYAYQRTKRCISFNRRCIKTAINRYEWVEENGSHKYKYIAPTRIDDNVITLAIITGDFSEVKELCKANRITYGGHDFNFVISYLKIQYEWMYKKYLPSKSGKSYDTDWQAVKKLYEEMMAKENRATS